MRRPLPKTSNPGITPYLYKAQLDRMEMLRKAGIGTASAASLATLLWGGNKVREMVGNDYTTDYDPDDMLDYGKSATSGVKASVNPLLEAGENWMTTAMRRWKMMGNVGWGAAATAAATAAGLVGAGGLAAAYSPQGTLDTVRNTLFQDEGNNDTRHQAAGVVGGVIGIPYGPLGVAAGYIGGSGAAHKLEGKIRDDWTDPSNSPTDHWPRPLGYESPASIARRTASFADQRMRPPQPPQGWFGKGSSAQAELKYLEQRRATKLSAVFQGSAPTSPPKRGEWRAETEVRARRAAPAPAPTPQGGQRPAVIKKSEPPLPGQKPTPTNPRDLPKTHQ